MKTKTSHLTMLIDRKLDQVGYMCMISEQLQCMQVYSILIDGLEHSFEVVLPTPIVGRYLILADKPLNMQTLADYTVPLIDAVAYALAFYYSMPSSVKHFVEQLGQLGTLRVAAVEHLKRFYELD